MKYYKLNKVCSTRCNIFLFFGILLIFFNKNIFGSAKALVGQNIRQARSGEFSYVTSIMKIEARHPQSGGEHFCTGVLITRKDILTSGHCLEEEQLNTTQVVVGTADIRNGSIFYPYWWITYDQWVVANNLTPQFNWNDLAIIRLSLEVPNNIIPIRLSRLTNTELYRANVLLVGWGVNNEGITPDIMNVADLKIIDNISCERKIERASGEHVSVNFRLLCTFVEPYILAEFGDSGAPLLFHNRLIAVTHGTVNQRRADQINLHFGIDFYRDFINAMKNNT